MDAGNDIEIPTFSIDTEIQKDISIDIEISIYDPLTSGNQFGKLKQTVSLTWFALSHNM